MSSDVLIGVDAGTSVIKAVAFDLNGRQIASANRRNSYETLPDGGVVQDMRRTWNDTVAVLREVTDTVGAERVMALGITAQGDGTWLIDADGDPVHDGWLWLDARSAVEAADLEASSGIDTIYRHTGAGVNVCQMRTQLLWMNRNTPEILERAATALHCKDWLYLGLTGVRASDPTEGVFTFGDFRSRDYSDDVLEALGLSHLRHLLPPILDGSVKAHGLTRSAAAETGLPEGLPVSLGYVDVICTALGAGLHDAEAMPGFSVLGSTGMHMRFAPDADAVSLNEDRSGYTMALPGKAFGQMQTNMAATLNIDWLLDLAAGLLESEGVTRSRADLLAGLDKRVLAARPGAALFHPYISAAGERGPFANPAARASLTGLDQSCGWFDMVRAVYDGLVLAARDCYTALGDIPAEIRLSGGAARSKTLVRLLASALNRPVRTVSQPEAGAAGAVMIAGIAQGIFADAADATRRWVHPLLQDPQAPDSDLIGTYDVLFAGYTATREAMQPAWIAQADMRGALR